MTQLETKLYHALKTSKGVHVSSFANLKTSGCGLVHCETCKVVDNAIALYETEVRNSAHQESTQ